MTFQYNGKEYDLRFKARHLPKQLRDVSGADLVILLSNKTTKEFKQTLLNNYVEGAIVL